MKITNNKPSFRAHLNTIDVLEVTTLKVLNNNGLNGIKNVISALNAMPKKATGKVGYRHFAEKIGTRIVQKYENLKNATNEINKLYKQSGENRPTNIQAVLKKITDEIGNNIDITI